MKIKTKLFLCFLFLSTLTLIVGLIFYVQLKNLIGPLTPQSIPKSVENLSNTIQRNKIISQLTYQSLLVDLDLQQYLYNRQLSTLQDYYLNEAILTDRFTHVKETDKNLWLFLSKDVNQVNDIRTRIVGLIRQGNLSTANDLLISSNYLEKSQNVRSLIFQYYLNLPPASTESSIVTVKLAAKNTLNILQDSLNTTIIIFIDAVIISIIFALLSVGNIVNPIHLLQKDIERIRSSNLNISHSSELLKIRGEVGDLARSFISLINNLQRTTVNRDELLIEIERRKHIEKELMQTALDLQASNRELDQFAYSASHDLRAPLRAISNLVQWIEDDSKYALSSTSLQHLELIKQRIKRLDNLINGILEYSRVGRINIEMSDVNINNIIREATDNLTPSKNIRFDIPKNIPVIKANPTSMTQIFQNLINNAIKYNDKSEPLITITYDSNETDHLFSVKDNGPGIPTEFHERIFSAFQTLNPRDTIEATGIGLAIVKKILDKHGGNIWLESEIGSGSTFYFTWPKIPSGEII